MNLIAYDASPLGEERVVEDGPPTHPNAEEQSSEVLYSWRAKIRDGSTCHMASRNFEFARLSACLCSAGRRRSEVQWKTVLIPINMSVTVGASKILVDKFCANLSAAAYLPR